MKKVFFAAGMLVLVACGNNAGKVKTDDANLADSTAVVCTKECTAKVWSEVYQDSILLSEKAIKVVSTDSTSTSYAFVVFAADSSNCELFLENVSYVLDKRQAKDSFVWNMEDDDTHNVRFVDGKLEIGQRANIVFKEETK